MNLHFMPMNHDHRHEIQIHGQVAVTTIPLPPKPLLHIITVYTYIE